MMQPQIRGLLWSTVYMYTQASKTAPEGLTMLQWLLLLSEQYDRLASYSYCHSLK